MRDKLREFCCQGRARGCPGPRTAQIQRPTTITRRPGTWTRDSLKRAVELLNEALRIDAKNARAWSALADCYALQGFYQLAPPGEAYAHSKQAALQALALDNSLAEAHVSLLTILTDYDWDWEGAEREFRAAIAIDPNYAVAWQDYGYALLAMGRKEEALVAMRRAEQIDPVSPSIQTSLVWSLFLLRQYPAGIDQLKRVLELYPEFLPAHQMLGMMYAANGQETAAAMEVSRAASLDPNSAITPAIAAYELARSGQKAAAMRILEKQPRTGDAPIANYHAAAAWLAMGERSQALAALNRCLYARSNWIVYLRDDPRFDSLRGDPQFEAIVQKLQRQASTGIAAQVNTR